MGFHVTTGLLFYPRGGSAQVVRYLAAALRDEGWSSSLVCGSLGAPGEPTNATSFFEDMDVRAMQYDPAVAAYRRGEDPIAHDPPMHPSYEDRAEVPDRVFAAVTPALGDHLAEGWERFLRGALDEPSDMLHVHHLSPLQEAFALVAPDLPLVTHLHGTELKMLDRIERLSEVARAQGTDLVGMADRAGGGRLSALEAYPEEVQPLVREARWEQWRHGAHWAERLRAAARSSDRLIAVSPHARDEAQRLLGVDGDRVTCIPNGVDTTVFDRRTIGREERTARWCRWLVEEPQGWDESGVPGSIRYGERDIGALVDPEATVLLFVGRFLDFKRVPLLLRAYAAARERFHRPAPLVIWGGFPGEWEGEHPYVVASEARAADVFFVGWRGHADLVLGLQCCDVMVAPSRNEPFGQVYLEAMACGLPVITTRSGGPLSFVNTERSSPNGWMVGVDDGTELTDAMVEAVNDSEARRLRSRNAYEQIRSAYSWRALARQFTTVYSHAMADARNRRKEHHR